MASPTEPTKRFKKISRNDGWVTAAAPLSKQPDNSSNPPKNQGRVKNTSCFSLQPQREFTLSVLRLDNGSLDPGTKATTWSSHRRKVQTLGNDFGQFLEGFLRWRLLCSDVHFPLRCFEDLIRTQSARCHHQLFPPVSHHHILTYYLNRAILLLIALPDIKRS